MTEVSPGKMAAPMELSCWGGGWGLPSVHSESLVVLVRPPCEPWRGRTGLASRGLLWGEGSAWKRQILLAWQRCPGSGKRHAGPASAGPPSRRPKSPEAGSLRVPDGRRGRGAGSRRLPLRMRLSEPRCGPE